MKTGLLIIVSIILCSCSEKIKHTQYSWEQTDSLKSTILKNDSSLMGCYKFTLVNNHVIVHNLKRGQTTNYKCYKIVNDSLQWVGNFLNIGKGPKEALRSVLIFNKQNNCLYIAASSGLVKVENMYRIDVSDINNLFNLNKYTPVKMPMENSIHFISPVNENEFIFSQLNEQDIMFYSYKTNEPKFTNLSMKYPEQPSPIAIGITEIAYNGSIIRHPEKQRYIYTSSYGNYALIFDYNNDGIQNITSLFELHPTYSFRERNGVQNFKPLNDCKLGFNATASLKYIYLLDRDYDSSKGATVMIFDWNGKPIRKLILDKNVSYIEIDDNDETLYAFIGSTADSCEQVIKYSI